MRKQLTAGKAGRKFGGGDAAAGMAGIKDEIEKRSSFQKQVLADRVA